MALLKRAGAPGLALMLAAGALVGLHELVHVARGQNIKPTGPKNELSLTAAPGANKSTSAVPGGAPSWTFNAAAESHVFHLDGDFDLPGGVQPVSGQVPLAPSPMPAPTNAVPLPPATDDFPLPTPLPNREPSAGPGKEGPPRKTSSGRRIIERELPNSSAEERNLWHEETKGLSLNDLRELMRIRAQLGRLSAPTREGDRSPGQPAFLPPGSTGIGNGPFYPPSNDALGPSAEPDPNRVIGETKAALVRARQLILHNIANAKTNGYKRQFVSFESASDRPMTQAPGDDPLRFSFDAPVEAGARLAPVVVDMSPGKLARTNRPMDLAIEGQGFFMLTDPKTKLAAYTRRGRFSTNASGKIVLLSAGREWVLTPAITIDSDFSDVEVGADGVVRVWNSQRLIQQIGCIQTVTFDSPSVLSPVDGTVFVKPPKTSPTVHSPGADGRLIRQGFLEESNVDVKQELEELMQLSAQSQALEQAARCLPSAASDSPPR